MRDNRTCNFDCNKQEKTMRCTRRGETWRCPNPAMAGHKNCEYHLLQRRKTQKDYRIKCMKNNKCMQCNKNTPEAGYKYCASCIKTQAANCKRRKARLKKQHRCYICGYPVTGKNLMCYYCLQKLSIRKARA